MVDIVSPKMRSKIMSRILGKNTKPELLVRKALFANGLRYRLHDKNLPGKPDLVFKSKGAVLFIHGCFWHGHDCHLFKLPATRADFWKNKILSNKARDEQSQKLLQTQGWRQGVIWECALKGKTRLPIEDIIEKCTDWLSSERKSFEIKGVK